MGIFFCKQADEYNIDNKNNDYTINNDSKSNNIISNNDISNNNIIFSIEEEKEDEEKEGKEDKLDWRSIELYITKKINIINNKLRAMDTSNKLREIETNITNDNEINNIKKLISELNNKYDNLFILSQEFKNYLEIKNKKQNRFRFR